MDRFKQDLILAPDVPRLIPYSRYSRRNADNAADLIFNRSSFVLGVSLQLSSSGCPTSAAFSTSQEVFVISLDTDPKQFIRDSRFKALLAGDCGTLTGFEMDRVALYLSKQSHHRVRGVDLSTLLSPTTAKPWPPSKVVDRTIGAKDQGHKIDKLWEVGGDWRDMCLRAWLAARVANTCLSSLEQTKSIDTSHLKPIEIQCLAGLTWQRDLVKRAQPKQSENEFSHVEGHGHVACLHNTRYSNRVRRSDQTSVEMAMSDGSKIFGRAIATRGRTTTINHDAGQLTGTVVGVRVLGRADPTMSERARREFILLVLLGERDLQASLFIQILWFPSSYDPIYEMHAVRSDVVPSVANGLNQSQENVVRAMIESGNSPVVVAHGPPGTGKTTTISAAVQIWSGQQCSTWICAQSNVAVKNIAESLFKRGVYFKLIVSKEFYVEWHEHLYEYIQRNLIRSDEIPSQKLELERLMNGSRVILCTLGMLSNPLLEESGLFNLAPVEQLVVDEASQIDIGDFMHVFHKSRKLLKACFFGDPKQLPPFNQDRVEMLQSVFDLRHVQHNAYFLNIQYRMPVPLGDFISREVYDGKLQSEHDITDMSCISFIDVSKGEEEHGGHSWKNIAEVHTIVHLVRFYYQCKNFCVITPYDAQRSAIEKQLKSQGLPWQNIFSVDSFQGHEADFVLISVVRTQRLGFLQSHNRMNVMLSRCKRGVVIVTNKEFIHQPAGQHTLVAKLSRYVEKRLGGGKTCWYSWKNVAEQTANLPGASASTAKVSNMFPSAQNLGIIAPMSNGGTTGPASSYTPPSLSSFPPLPASVPSQYRPIGRWSSPEDVDALKAGAVRPVNSTSVQCLQSYTEAVYSHRGGPRSTLPADDIGYNHSGVPSTSFLPSYGTRTKVGPSYIQETNEPLTKDHFPSLSPSSTCVSSACGTWISRPRISTERCPSKHNPASGSSSEVVGLSGGMGEFRDQTLLDSDSPVGPDPFPALCEPTTKPTVHSNWASAAKIRNVRSAPTSRLVVTPGGKKPHRAKSKPVFTDVSLSEEGFPFLRRFS